MANNTTILIPLDSSKNSHFCLDYYLNNIHKEGNTVRCIYVADYFGDLGPLEGPSPGRVQELEEQDQARAAAVEKEVMGTFKNRGIGGDFRRLFGKDAWHVIVDEADKLQATMIVMGSRGLGTLRRTLLGSVSDSVLHHAHCPVLICKMPSDKH